MQLQPPRPKGPPLNALRAFEAAARLGGFAAAAEELSVTPGAVAQHVKALEEWVGDALFERRSRGVVLTGLGRDALGDFSRAFDQLGDAVMSLRARGPQSQIRIAALPAVAQFWLAPRLRSLRERLPDAAVSIVAMERPPNFRREPFDLALFFEDRPPQDAIVLADDLIMPVCTPEIAGSLATPRDLAAVVLLHDSAWTQDWPRWLEAAGIDPSTISDGASHSLYSLVIDAARRGVGVAMAHRSLLGDDLRAGTLVAPFDLTVDTGRQLVLTAPQAHHRTDTVDHIIQAFAGMTDVR